MIRLLHTADWHLGSTLEGLSRDTDHAQFLDWLAGTIEHREVDVLVIAGDVFDHAQPSAEAQRLYFDFLQRIARSVVRHVVVVGGNHDSPTRLEAPRAVLRALDVHVVGGLPADPARWRECLHPIAGKHGGIDATVLAVPFVHEYRLGVRTAMSDPREIAESFRERFQLLYHSLCSEALARNADAPLIATGHLAVRGADAKDAPKEVHLIATIGGLTHEIFDPRIAYVALGHIHRSYAIEDRPIWYSGSPIALSMREALSPRRVIQVEIDGNSPARIEPIEVPTFRALIAIEGSVESVCEQLHAITWSSPLPPYVRARIEVEHFTPSFDDRVVASAQAAVARGLRLVGVRQDVVKVTPAGPPDSFAEPLHTLEPEEVFLRLCRAKGTLVDEALLRAFREIVHTSVDTP